MTVLLDTNVLSELVRPQPDQKVTAFVRRHRDAVISAITLHELAYGADRARDPGRRAKLRAWIASLQAQFTGRVVAVDADIGEQSGRLRAASEAQGRPVEAIDAIIASCALARGAVIATRNVSDFEAMGVQLVNPWD